MLPILIKFSVDVNNASFQVRAMLLGQFSSRCDPTANMFLQKRPWKHLNGPWWVGRWGMQVPSLSALPTESSQVLPCHWTFTQRPVPFLCQHLSDYLSPQPTYLQWEGRYESQEAKRHHCGRGGRGMGRTDSGKWHPVIWDTRSVCAGVGWGKR